MKQVILLLVLVCLVCANADSTKKYTIKHEHSEKALVHSNATKTAVATDPITATVSAVLSLTHIGLQIVDHVLQKVLSKKAQDYTQQMIQKIQLLAKKMMVEIMARFESAFRIRARAHPIKDMEDDLRKNITSAFVSVTDDLMPSIDGLGFTYSDIFNTIYTPGSSAYSVFSAFQTAFRASAFSSGHHFMEYFTTSALGSVPSMLSCVKTTIQISMDIYQIWLRVSAYKKFKDDIETQSGVILNDIKYTYCLTALKLSRHSPEMETIFASYLKTCEPLFVSECQSSRAISKVGAFPSTEEYVHELEELNKLNNLPKIYDLIHEECDQGHFCDKDTDVQATVVKAKGLTWKKYSTVWYQQESLDVKESESNPITSLFFGRLEKTEQLEFMQTNAFRKEVVGGPWGPGLVVHKAITKTDRGFLEDGVCEVALFYPPADSVLHMFSLGQPHNFLPHHIMDVDERPWNKKATDWARNFGKHFVGKYDIISKSDLDDKSYKGIFLFSHQDNGLKSTKGAPVTGIYSDRDLGEDNKPIHHPLKEEFPFIPLESLIRVPTAKLIAPANSRDEVKASDTGKYKWNIGLPSEPNGFDLYYEKCYHLSRAKIDKVPYLSSEDDVDEDATDVGMALKRSHSRMDLTHDQIRGDSIDRKTDMSGSGSDIGEDEDLDQIVEEIIGKYEHTLMSSHADEATEMKPSEEVDIDKLVEEVLQNWDDEEGESKDED